MNAWLGFFSSPHPYLQSKKLDSGDLQNFRNVETCSWCTTNAEDLYKVEKIPNIHLAPMGMIKIVIRIAYIQKVKSCFTAI